jgi:hypothetical protein
MCCGILILMVLRMRVVTGELRVRGFDASRSRILHVGISENQAVALLGHVGLHD